MHPVTELPAPVDHYRTSVQQLAEGKWQNAGVEALQGILLILVNRSRSGTW